MSGNQAISRFAHLAEATGAALLAGTIVAIVEFGAFYPSTPLALAVGSVAALLVFVVWFRVGRPPKYILDFFELTGWILCFALASGVVALFTFSVPPQVRSLLLPLVVLGFLAFVVAAWLRYLLPYDPNYVTRESREPLPFWVRVLMHLPPGIVAAFFTIRVGASAPTWERTAILMASFALVAAPEYYVLERLQKDRPEWWQETTRRLARLVPRRET